MDEGDDSDEAWANEPGELGQWEARVAALPSPLRALSVTPWGARLRTEVRRQVHFAHLALGTTEVAVLLLLPAGWGARAVRLWEGRVVDAWVARDGESWRPQGFEEACAAGAEWTTVNGVRRWAVRCVWSGSDIEDEVLGWAAERECVDPFPV